MFSVSCQKTVAIVTKKWSQFSYLNHPNYEQRTLSTALYVTPSICALEEQKIPLNSSKYVIFRLTHFDAHGNTPSLPVTQNYVRFAM